MPIYEYRCSNGHVFDVIQSMSDEPVVACEECGAPVERVFHPVAVHFKGSGFYSTDYAGKRKEAASSDGDSAASGDGAEKRSGEKSESKGKTEASESKGGSDS